MQLLYKIKFNISIMQGSKLNYGQKSHTCILFYESLYYNIFAQQQLFHLQHMLYFNVKNRKALIQENAKINKAVLITIYVMFIIVNLQQYYLQQPQTPLQAELCQHSCNRLITFDGWIDLTRKISQLVVAWHILLGNYNLSM